MVSKVDSVVGRIVADLQRFTYTTVEGEERSIFNDTIIIFSSDNGGMSEVKLKNSFIFLRLKFFLSIVNIIEEGFIQKRRQRSSLLFGGRIDSIPCRTTDLAPG